jgi:hypothetical protein
MNEIKEKNVLAFETTIPVFSWFITKVMGMVILIPFTIIGMISVFSIINGGKFSDLTPDIYFALGFISLIFVLTYIAMMIMFPNGFISIVQISEKGISQIALSSSKKISQAAIVGGILTKSAGAAGAGLLAEAGDNRTISWKEMKIVKVNSNSKYMYFSKGRMTLFPIGFFCPEKQYKKTIELISKYFPNFHLQ